MKDDVNTLQEVFVHISSNVTEPNAKERGLPR